MRLWSARAVNRAACVVAAALAPLQALHAQRQVSADTAVTAGHVIRDTVAVSFDASPSASADVSPVATANSARSLRAAVHRPETIGRLVPNAAATNPHLGQSRAMMIVGAAALITGAIIGGDPGTIIMVGGAVVGLYGLYQYLQ